MSITLESEYKECDQKHATGLKYYAHAHISHTNFVFLCSCLYYFVEAAAEMRDWFIHCLTELGLHEFAPPVVAAAEKTELKLPDYYH